MRVKTFFRMLRIVSAIVLFFFVWTFGEVWQAVAWAAAPNQTKKQQARNEKPKPASTEERFETELDGLREQIGKAGDKAARGEDIAQNIEGVKAGKSALEAQDAALRKQFSDTERTLIDKKLPKEILERHRKFTAQYEANYKELRYRLAGIEQARTQAEKIAEIKKTSDFLARVKRPDLHKKLDPENLPFKARKATKRREPRSKEQFERDFPKQKPQGKNKIADSRWLPDLLYAGKPQPKPVLLAFNKIASDVPFTFDYRPAQPELAFTDSSPFLLAQAVVQPGPEDLAETPDITFSPAIRAKAQELGGNPVRIYEWVRSNIEYAPTYGSISGADQCLQSKICNDMDTASLLIALLRVSGIYAHYVYGTIQIPNDKAMNWVGGVTDPKMAGTIFASTGIPARGHISGSTIDYQLIEHVWVKAFIDYIPSRGAVHKQGDTWIPLDASYKSYTYTQGIDIASAVPFDAQTFANQILSTATTNTIDGSVTNVNATYVQQTVQNYYSQVQNYIQQNYPNATVGDVSGKKEIIQQNYPILIGTLPYKTVQVGSEFSTVPDSLRETISFNIPDPTGSTAGLIYTAGMPQIAGKKITLSFSPATTADQATIESYLPQPHADGSPIQPSELPASLPAYLINLKSELRIDGQVVATGASVTMGSIQSFTMTINEPGIGMSNIDNIVKAGEYFAIGVDTGRVGENTVNNLKTKLDSTRIKIEAGLYDVVTKDDVVGGILYSTIASYFAALDAADEIAARAANVIRYRVPSVGMFSLSLNIDNVFGIPISAGPKGMMMDVDRLVLAVFSKDGNIDSVTRYMLSEGVNSSTLEHLVPEQVFSTTTNPVQGISAIKSLQQASNQGIPIYIISQSNINTLLPQLQLNEDVKSDIQNAVNVGDMVIVQKEYVTYNDWNGCGFIVIDPTTGAGAYKISDGLNGGGFKYKFWTFMLGLAWFALIFSLVLIAAIVILLLPEIIAGLTAISITVGAAVYIALGENLFAILMDAAYLCFFSGMETPPDLPVNGFACAEVFIIAMLTRNAYR